MQPKKRKQEVGQGRQLQSSEEFAAATAGNGEKNVQKKVVKAATASSTGAASPTCNRSEKKKKKKKRKKSPTPESEEATPKSEEATSESEELTPESEEASAQPVTFPQYSAIRANDWRRKLKADQVVRISTMRNSAVALDWRLATGTFDHGMYSTGDVEGVWGGLMYARMYIHQMVDALGDHLVDKLDISLKEVLNAESWGAKLMGVMKFSTVPALGEGADAALEDMKSAVDRVCAANEKFDQLDDRDTLIEAYAECMSVVCSLWLEVCDLVGTKFKHKRPVDVYGSGLKVNMDPRRTFFAPSAPWSKSLPAAEAMWPQLMGTPFPVPATKGEATTKEDEKVKKKNNKKKKNTKATPPL